MAGKRRFSICVDEDLVEQLDRMIAEEGYGNRSQTISAMISERLVRHREKLGDGTVAGTITLIFDHHKRGLQARMTGIQHAFLKEIVTSVHLHLTHHLCMEVLLVKGPAARLRQLARKLTTLKGVAHGALSISGTAG
jgi:CopG family nickel-responsive transcriptional regulator